MNENIKLLIMKAGGIICSDMATGTIEKIDYLRFDAEKFAELIVRECCDWIDGSPATDAGQLLLTKSFITANLKGHFGVKE